jgi:hypothetical protein
VATLASPSRPAARSRRRLIVGAVTAVALVAVAAAVAGGTAIYRAAQDDYGRSAASLALAIGCSEFQPRTDTAGAAHFHEQGTCTLDGFTVKLTTFNDEGEQQAYGILMDTLVPVYTHRGGAYAEGAGWNAADDVALSKQLADQVSNRLGGSVHEFAAPAS